MSITIELPADVEKSLKTAAEAEGMDPAAVVAALVTDAFRSWPGETLRPISAYPSEAAYVADAAQKASSFGVDPAAATGIAAGLADAAAGRTLTLEQSQNEFDRAFAEHFRKP